MPDTTANATPTAPQGAGLGLPIALAITQAHGGTIGVNTTVGQGSTFTVRVPVDGPEDAET